MKPLIIVLDNIGSTLSLVSHLVEVRTPEELVQSLVQADINEEYVEPCAYEVLGFEVGNHFIDFRVRQGEIILVGFVLKVHSRSVQTPGKYCPLVQSPFWI